MRLIHAQGRVVRLEARTRSSCEYDGVESEADTFKLLVEHYHEISHIPMRHSAPLRLKGQNCNTILLSKVYRGETADFAKTLDFRKKHCVKARYDRLIDKFTFLCLRTRHHDKKQTKAYSLPPARKRMHDVNGPR